MPYCRDASRRTSTWRRREGRGRAVAARGRGGGGRVGQVESQQHARGGRMAHEGRGRAGRTSSFWAATGLRVTRRATSAKRQAARAERVDGAMVAGGRASLVGGKLLEGGGEREEGEARTSGGGLGRARASRHASTLSFSPPPSTRLPLFSCLRCSALTRPALALAGCHPRPAARAAALAVLLLVVAPGGTLSSRSTASWNVQSSRADMFEPARRV